MFLLFKEVSHGYEKIDSQEFQRVLSLPDDVDQDRVNAKFKKGVLTVTMPRKALPKADVKKIEVRTEG
jgi:HSP20 family molecular chaperone IbpA